jgi:serine/threonine protein kinase
LHSEGVIHRDIKCANILVSSEGQIKLSDFGASKKIHNFDPSQDYNNFCLSLKGSPYWMAPEVARE